MGQITTGGLPGDVDTTVDTRAFPRPCDVFVISDLGATAMYGADGRSRTGTAYATTPSR